MDGKLSTFNVPPRQRPPLLQFALHNSPRIRAARIKLQIQQLSIPAAIYVLLLCVQNVHILRKRGSLRIPDSKC